MVVLCDTVGETGGTERYYERVLPALSRRTEILLLARNVERSGMFGIPARQIAWASEDGAPDPVATAQVVRAIAEFAPDVVLAGNVIDASILSAARRAPRFAVRIHDHRSFCPNGDRRFPQMPGICTRPMGTACALNALVRGCVKGPRAATLDRLRARESVRDAIALADAVLVSSRYMERTCVENGIDRARIALTPPPLPDDAFAHEIAAPPRHPRLLFAGRIVPQKGLESLVRALGAIAPDRRPSLDVAGSGDMRDVVGLAARHDVAIDYHGFRDTVQLRALIDACTAVAVPSLWAEPFGLIGIEAQARGRPAVAYDVGGIGEWLGGAGALVRVGDERSLARAIERVCAPSAWPAFARAAFAQSASFNLTAHVALLQRVLTSAPPKESVLCAS